MAKLGYTEFSFGYAFTENLIRSSAAAPHGAPVFPNLIQEAKLGYDVRINLPGVPLFFQYKLPEIMKRSTAAEIADYHLPDFSVPFFRMHLMRRSLSAQHHKLIELEQAYPGRVLYASPCLQDISQFNTAYNAARVHERSAFFSPNEIGLLSDNKDHSVAYRDGSLDAYFCSEPRKIAATSYADLTMKARSLFEGGLSSSLESAAAQLRGSIRQFVSPQMRSAEAEIEQRVRSRRTPPLSEESSRVQRTIEDILIAREMTRVDLGVDLLVAQPHI
jgi:hypothetical protein